MRCIKKTVRKGKVRIKDWHQQRSQINKLMVYLKVLVKEEQTKANMAEG